jgi:glycoprotein 6-alpha-L-fucosyltransferase
VVDGYQSWRETEHKSLSKLMQARLNSLQNPSKSCTDVKRVTCNINKGCGYGCEIHHAMHCFHIAYALGRPMFLFSGRIYFYSKIFKIQIFFFLEGWRYNPGGFAQIFQPLSQNCTKEMFSGAAPWSKFIIFAF